MLRAECMQAENGGNLGEDTNGPQHACRIQMKHALATKSISYGVPCPTACRQFKAVQAGQCDTHNTAGRCVGDCIQERDLHFSCFNLIIRRLLLSTFLCLHRVGVGASVALGCGVVLYVWLTRERGCGVRHGEQKQRRKRGETTPKKHVFCDRTKRHTFRPICKTCKTRHSGGSTLFRTEGSWSRWPAHGVLSQDRRRPSDRGA